MTKEMDKCCTLAHCGFKTHCGSWTPHQANNAEDIFLALSLSNTQISFYILPRSGWKRNAPRSHISIHIDICIDMYTKLFLIKANGWRFSGCPKDLKNSNIRPRLCIFFSPPSFPRVLNQKKDDCVKKARLQNPQDNKIPGRAKSREIPGMKC